MRSPHVRRADAMTEDSYSSEVLSEVERDVHEAAVRRLQTLQRAQGQRLHLVLGAPWKQALGAYIAGNGTTQESVWQAPPDYDKGDLLLTVLDSRPRLLLCLERARRPAASGGSIYVDDAVTFDPLIPLPALAIGLAGRLPAAPSTLADELADEVLGRLAQEVASPSDWWGREGTRSSSTTRARSAGLQATVLARSGGRCAGCDRNYGALLGGDGLYGLEVHHLDSLARSASEVVQTSPKRLVALCGGCHGVAHSPSQPSVDDLRFAWRPSCPQCDAMVTRAILYGDAGALLDPRHFVAGGCLSGAGSPDWSCGACGHVWLEAL